MMHGGSVNVQLQRVISTNLAHGYLSGQEKLSPLCIPKTADFAHMRLVDDNTGALPLSRFAYPCLAVMARRLSAWRSMVDQVIT